MSLVSQISSKISPLWRQYGCPDSVTIDASRLDKQGLQGVHERVETVPEKCQIVAAKEVYESRIHQRGLFEVLKQYRLAQERF